MSELVYLFAGVYFLSIFLYFVFPERLRLWVILASSSISASILGFFGYKDPYILAAFFVVFLLGWLSVILSRS